MKIDLLRIMQSLLSFLLLANFTPVYSNIRLPAIIGNNMVLQQQSLVKLWGWGEPGEKLIVTTSWNNKTYQPVIVDGNANWQLQIQTPAAGGPYDIQLTGNNQLSITNVVAGEVWLCSGQSNMEMSGQWGLQDIKEEYKKCRNKDIRFFRVSKAAAPYPQQDCTGEWVVCDSTTLQNFSATGYFFGKRLNNVLNLPVGLIQACWSGSSAEVWTPGSIISNDKILKEAATKIVANGQVANLPGYAYNAMIAPLTNFTIAGVIWYQGENNTINASVYPRLFPAMIDSWRAAWHADMPFYFVQIAPFRYSAKNTGALMREAQTRCSGHFNTGMVIITDLVTDVNNVHPFNKHDVGFRLANWALAETYHQPGIVYKYPLFESMSIVKGKATILISNAGKGLETHGAAATQLSIAGTDSIFHPAKSILKDNRIIVWSEEVRQPIAVRYEFSDTAIGNIFNKDGLPLGPFRTDKWPVENEYKPGQTNNQQDLR
jgi:sialate O-acetylesterase